MLPNPRHKQRQGKKMARIAGIDLPRSKRIDIALTYIGIGRATAVEILEKAKIDGTTAHALTDQDVVDIRRSSRRIRSKVTFGVRFSVAQATDGSRPLPRASASSRTARSWTAYQQCAHP